MKDYKRLKALKKISWVLVGQSKFISCPKWNKDTGDPAEPELYLFNESELISEREKNEVQRVVLVARNIEIDELIADSKKVK